MKHVLVLIVLLAACSGTLQAQTPAEQQAWLAKAQPATVPPAFATWWTDVASDCGCAPAITFDQLLWYTIPGDAFQCGRAEQCAGIFSQDDGIIVLAKRYFGNERVIKHEMLHAMLNGDQGHHHAAWVKYGSPLAGL